MNKTYTMDCMGSQRDGMGCNGVAWAKMEWDGRYGVA